MTVIRSCERSRTSCWNAARWTKPSSGGASNDRVSLMTTPRRPIGRHSVHELCALAKTSAVTCAEDPPEEPQRQDGEGESEDAEDEVGPAWAVGVRAEAVLERPHGDEEE